MVPYEKLLRAQRADFKISKFVVIRLAYVLVRAMLFNKKIKQSYGFPQTTSYKTVPQEQNRSATVLLKALHCVDDMLTGHWKGTNLKL